MSRSGTRLSWNQAICERCWLQLHPGQAPIRVLSSCAVLEVCSYCGGETVVGIYVAPLSAFVRRLRDSRPVQLQPDATDSLFSVFECRDHHRLEMKVLV